MASSLKYVALAATAYATGVTATKSYSVTDVYNSTNFLGKFDNWVSTLDTGVVNDVDPTGGYVQYQSRTDALKLGLISVDDDEIYIGPETSLYYDAGGYGRKSVRLESHDTYNHGLFIADFTYLPKPTCGAWPAFWMFGEPWPTKGEIDIVENWNDLEFNRNTAHTDNPSVVGTCTIKSADMTASLIEAANCYDYAEGQWPQQGCSADSYKLPFGSANGGVYALEWTSDSIKLWSWTHLLTPVDVTLGKPLPLTWGLPDFTIQDCNIDKAFKDMKLVFNIDFCGVAGQQGIWDSCAAKTGYSSCQNYVASEPEAFTSSYFKVADIKVYQQADVQTTTSTTSSSTLATSSSSTLATSSSSTLTTSSSSTLATSSSSTLTTSSSSTLATSSSSTLTTSSSSTLTTPSSTSSVITTTSSTSSSLTSTSSSVSTTTLTTVSQTSSSTTSQTSSSSSSSASTSSATSTSATDAVTASSSSSYSTSETSSVTSPTTTPSATASSSSYSDTSVSSSASTSTSVSVTETSSSTITSLSSNAPTSSVTSSSSYASDDDETCTDEENSTHSQTYSATTTTGSSVSAGYSVSESVSSTVSSSDIYSVSVTSSHAVSTSVSSSTASDTTDIPEYTTSTVWSTRVQTITSCAASVTDCPARVTTEVVAIYTTVCPVTASEGSTQHSKTTVIPGSYSASGQESKTAVPTYPGEGNPGHSSKVTASSGAETTKAGSTGGKTTTLDSTTTTTSITKVPITITVKSSSSSTSSPTKASNSSEIVYVTSIATVIPVTSTNSGSKYNATISTSQAGPKGTTTVSPGHGGSGDSGYATVSGGAKATVTMSLLLLAGTFAFIL